jgi:peptidyl-prolyl cis-trans isomerase C
VGRLCTIVLRIGLAAWIGSVALLAGCGSKNGSKEAAGPAPVITGEPAKQLAKVNDKVITLGEVNQVVKAWKTGRMTGIDPNGPEGDMQRKAVDELVGRELLFEEAKKAGTVPSDSEVAATISQIKSQFPNPAAFQQALDQQGMTEDQVVQGFKMETAIRRYVKSAVQDTIKVTPEQARTYFDSHPTDFQHPEQARARHILIRADQAAPPEQQEAARKRAADISDQIKKGGNFAQIAATKSEDPGSAANGGELGFFSRGQMVAPFDSIAFSLQPGQVSDVVRTPYGFHIIQLEEKRPEGTFSFDEVQGRLLQVLYTKRTTDRVNALIEELKSKAKIKKKI